MKHLVVCVFSCLLFFSCASTKTNINKNEYNYLDGMEQIVVSLKANLKNANKLRIAVLPILQENGNRTLLGDNTANNLQAGLFDLKAYTLVERERVDSIINEYDFSLNGLVDSNTMKELGKLLAVDTIVVGTIRDELAKYSFYIRAIDIESGKVLSIANVLINKDANIEHQFKETVEYSNNNYSGGYALTIQSMRIALKNKDGLPWDALSRADVVFKVFIDDVQVYRSKTFDGFPLLSINEKIDIVLQNNALLKIVVYDEDVSALELIDSVTFTPDDIKRMKKENESIIKKTFLEEMVLSLRKM